MVPFSHAERFKQSGLPDPSHIPLCTDLDRWRRCLNERRTDGIHVLPTRTSQQNILHPGPVVGAANDIGHGVCRFPDPESRTYQQVRNARRQANLHDAAK